ncbi:DUF1840 domain-containing protein [Parapusillimonas granuli]|uniref:DUF1840 domain-containing protein n=1 Tax=Parapusillimonas granuli TaxID=380911 RepID=A0A853FQV9_9BURK|nr:DUF1840 domain-containing protein [Parapusillimonas granuli]MBB5216490.1 hypothetical protein [Parapusillimonas granuli]MEB2399767.1 DUF1840 domain-containing protein [Alcaligenaceae bacterium]NYT48204.1 DUF1840 domain-containing protein [Parapusillimonas granuli]
MLVVFHSKAAAEVLMFSKHALPILKAAGKPYTDTLPERGVITRDQLDDAIKGIEHAMALDTETEYTDNDDDNDSKTHPISQSVSFRRRAFPLLAMLRLSREHDADVIWEPAPKW